MQLRFTMVQCLLLFESVGLKTISHISADTAWLAQSGHEIRISNQEKARRKSPRSRRPLQGVPPLYNRTSAMELHIIYCHYELTNSTTDR